MDGFNIWMWVMAGVYVTLALCVFVLTILLIYDTIKERRS